MRPYSHLKRHMQKLIFLSLHWKYRSYDHFSMPTYFPTTLPPTIFVAIARAASLGHCPHHRRANYKILFRDIIFIMIALILQNLQRLFNAYLLPNHPVRFRNWAVTKERMV